MSTVSQTLSLFIPMIYGNIKELDIKQTFERLNIGIVDSVKFVARSSKEEGKSGQNKAYVFFKSWNNNAKSREIQDKIQTEGSFRFQYSKRNEHNYWMLVENTRITKEKQAASKILGPVVQVGPIAQVGPVTIPSITVDEYEEYVEIPADAEGDGDFSMVSSDYASALENEISFLRNEYAMIQNAYSQLYHSVMVHNANIQFYHHQQQQMMMDKTGECIEDGECIETA